MAREQINGLTISNINKQTKQKKNVYISINLIRHKTLPKKGKASLFSILLEIMYMCYFS